jgi:hypothetical protein
VWWYISVISTTQVDVRGSQQEAALGKIKRPYLKNKLKRTRDVTKSYRTCKARGSEFNL